ncbi:MAG: ATP-binding protein [Actinomycetota bacterium]
MNDNLTIFNPWWQNKEVDKNLKGKRRKIFYSISKYINTRQMIILSGLRRVGKTTLMFQIIDELINEGINPYHILYFSFDEEEMELNEIIKNYEINILKNRLTSTRTYIFLDEIQKLNNWPSKVKILYDMYPETKIFLSGSASINLMKNTRESLAGRFFDFQIKVLDFDEYLEFIEVRIDKERENIFEKEIKSNFHNYIKTGGFIETIKLNEEMQKKYFKEGLLERVIFKDLPGIYSINSPELLLRLLKIIANNPGMLLDYKNMANDLKIDNRTLSNYISYLEYAMLVRKLYNYSPNLLTSEKKLKKIYLSNIAFSISLNYNVDLSLLLEQYFVNFLKPRFFYRDPQKDEVDIILELDNEQVPIEVKIRNKINHKTLKPVVKFLKKFGLRKGYMISKDSEKVFQIGRCEVEVYPYWKYWTIKKNIGF